MTPDWIAVLARFVDIGYGVIATSYHDNKLPPERRMVLVQIGPTDSEAPCVAVGYMKFAAGDGDSPGFIVPGARPHFVVTHWADCLGDDFTAPLWKMTNHAEAVR